MYVYILYIFIDKCFSGKPNVDIVRFYLYNVHSLCSANKSFNLLWIDQANKRLFNKTIGEKQGVRVKMNRSKKKTHNSETKNEKRKKICWNKQKIGFCECEHVKLMLKQSISSRRQPNIWRLTCICVYVATGNASIRYITACVHFRAEEEEKNVKKRENTSAKRLKNRNNKKLIIYLLTWNGFGALLFWLQYLCSLFSWCCVCVCTLRWISFHGDEK